MGIRVTRLTHRLPELRAGMHDKAAAVVSKIAYDIEAGAKQRAAVDTSDMRNSIEALPVTDLSWEVTVGVEYAIFQEMGTYKMPAHPFMIPAAEAARGPFIAAMKQVATG